MENIYLTHETARWFWDTYYLASGIAKNNQRTGVLRNAAHTAEDIRRALAGTIFEGQPIHVALPDNNKNAHDGITFHVCKGAYPATAFVRFMENIFVASPELCYLQAAQKLSRIRLAEYGCNLCGTFNLNPFSEFGVEDRGRILTVKELQRFLKDCEGKRGIKEARWALEYIIENSASPRETKGALILSLPKRLGGYGLPTPKLNYQIDIPQSLRYVIDLAYIKADYYWEGTRVTAEYDSDTRHAGAADIARDSIRRNALIHMHYESIGITKAQLDSIHESDNVAEVIRRAIKAKPRPNPKTFWDKQADLRKELDLPY